jgi:cytidine deaminase
VSFIGNQIMKVNQKKQRSMTDPSVLMEAALAARENASAPFSKFKVGAALETADGRIFTGCNIENATYGLTMCAERVAAFKAVSEGQRSFSRILIVADSKQPTPPCGACRQILWELAGDIEVIEVTISGKKARYRLSKLFPRPFDARFLPAKVRKDSRKI